MYTYKVIRKPGSSADAVSRALCEAAKEGWYLEFVDNGDYVMAKWDNGVDEDCPVVRENENEDTVDTE